MAGQRQVIKHLSVMPAMPRLRHPTIIPRGPRFLAHKATQEGGPDKPPPGFVIGKTSASEWSAYWALAKIFRNPLDPTKPPFTGGWPDWVYQLNQKTNFGVRGTSNVDFAVNLGRGTVGVRVQTWRYHEDTTAAKHAYDSAQKAEEERYIQIVDVYENDLLGDPSGAKYVVTMKRAIGLLTRIDPVVGGTGGGMEATIRGMNPS